MSRGFYPSRSDEQGGNILPFTKNNLQKVVTNSLGSPDEKRLTNYLELRDDLEKLNLELELLRANLAAT